jgi:hypothetical protein
MFLFNLFKRLSKIRATAKFKDDVENKTQVARYRKLESQMHPRNQAWYTVALSYHRNIWVSRFVSVHS